MKRKQNLFILLTLLTLTGGMKLFAQTNSNESKRDHYTINYKNDQNGKKESIDLILQQQGVRKKVRVLNHKTRMIVSMTVGFMNEDKTAVKEILYPAVTKGSSKETTLKNEIMTLSNELNSRNQKNFTITNNCGGKTEISDASFFTKEVGYGNATMDLNEDIFVTIPEEKGYVIFIAKTVVQTEVIRFKYNTSFGEILGEETKENAEAKWIDWLKKEDKKLTEDENLYIDISQKIYDALVCDSPYKDLYTTEDTYLYRKYLKLKFDESFAEKVYSQEERNNVAKEAEKYLYQAVEYQDKKKNPNVNEIYKDGKQIFKDSYWTNKGLSGTNLTTIGNPLPYCKNGTDTPERFYDNMEKMIKEILKLKEEDTIETTSPESVGLWSKFIGKYNLIDKGVDNKGIFLNVVNINNNTKYNESDYEDIENKIAIIPDVTMAERGDIIVLKNNDKQTIETGIIIQVPATVDTNNFGKDEKNLFSQIKAVYVDAKTQYVTVLSMEEIYEKFPNSSIFAGRLLKEDLKEGMKNTRAYFTQATELNWNIEDESPALCQVTIGKMYETDQRDQNDIYRWIPNTGEYLELTDISVTLKTKLNIDINIDGVNSKLMFVGLKDRDYDKDPTGANGNIYKNKADNFTVRFFAHESKDKFEEKKLTRNEKEKDLYISEELKEVKIGANGKLVEGTEPLVIAIRPESATQAYPGDDFYLNFKVVNEITKKDVKSFNSDEKDYVAVYDKKMLWRANLYIDEDGDDWNDVHPWNAPVAGDKLTGTWGDITNTDVFLASWNASDWGYNEWNKSYDLSTNYNVTDLTTLNTGDGKQVVKYTDWTPLRVVGTETSTNLDNYSNNFISNRVSYDYDKTGENPDTITKAWDSPFDFLWKLNEQKKLIISHFTPLVTQAPDEFAIFPKNATQNIEVPSYVQTAKTNKKLVEELFDTKAVYNIWGYYWKATENNITSYMPGLGLCLKYKDNTSWHVLDYSSYDFSSKRGAGTDCIGFVERACSYRNTIGDRASNRIYKWSQLPADRAETTNLSTWEQEYETGTRSLSYPTEANSLASVILRQSEFESILTKYDTEYSELTTSLQLKFNNVKNKILHIIPGDIIYYGSQQYPREHIAMIQEIDYDSVNTATTLNELLSCIKVIESVYYAEVNYVQKRLITEGKTSGNCTFIKDDSGNYRYYFYINRLR